jgi:hypothetical protein
MQVKMMVPRLGLIGSGLVLASRAISVQLASGNQRTGCTVILAALVALGLDVRVDRIRDPPVSATRLMLVDQRGTLAIVPHPCHQIPQASTTVRRELVTRMPQVMDVQARGPDRRHRVRPPRHLVEVTAPQRHTPLAREDERTGLIPDEVGQMLAQSRDNHAGDTHQSPTRPGLRRPEEHSPCRTLDVGSAHPYSAPVQI